MYKSGDGGEITKISATFVLSFSRLPSSWGQQARDLYVFLKKSGGDYALHIIVFDSEKSFQLFQLFDSIAKVLLGYMSCHNKRVDAWSHKLLSFGFQCCKSRKNTRIMQIKLLKKIICIISPHLFMQGKSKNSNFACSTWWVLLCHPWGKRLHWFSTFSLNHFMAMGRKSLCPSALRCA